LVPFINVIVFVPTNMLQKKNLLFFVRHYPTTALCLTSFVLNLICNQLLLSLGQQTTKREPSHVFAANFELPVIETKILNIVVDLSFITLIVCYSLKIYISYYNLVLTNINAIYFWCQGLLYF